jgi:diketogulonate reductase-like aldo/keto reductase
LKNLKLNDGNEIPILGLGTWKLKGNDCIQAVEYALEVGYRHIDTADFYGNHEQVGEALRNSGISRNEVFITSKVWRKNLKREDLIASCKRNLDELQMDYIDLYLVHWPSQSVPIKETLETMEDVKEQGLIKSFGVSNFTISHLQEAMQTSITPSVNQVEFHPTLNQQELLRFCNDHEIVLTAYSPVGRGKDLRIEAIGEIAERYDRSIAQVILAWLMSKNIVVIPKAGSKEHILDNFNSLDLILEVEDIKIIDELDKDKRYVNPFFADFD